MGRSCPACLHGGQEWKETSPELKDSVWHYGELLQDQCKLAMRRQALFFSCRREGLFHPMGNVLDKGKLIIYRWSFQSFAGSCTPPPSLGWDGLVTLAVLCLGGGLSNAVLGLDHPRLINSKE